MPQVPKSADSTTKIQYEVIKAEKKYLILKANNVLTKFLSDLGDKIIHMLILIENAWWVYFHSTQVYW